MERNKRFFWGSVVLTMLLAGCQCQNEDRDNQDNEHGARSGSHVLVNPALNRALNPALRTSTTSRPATSGGIGRTNVGTTATRPIGQSPTSFRPMTPPTSFRPMSPPTSFRPGSAGGGRR
jgi:hypothetical protein